MIIDGKKIAQEIIDGLKKLEKPKKFFAAVLVGENPESVSFLKQKEKAAKELGIDFRLYSFPAETKQDILRKEILKIAQHKTCGGVIVQLPLPAHINKHYILNAIPREKDTDVLGERALGTFYTGRNAVLPPACGVVKKVLNFVNSEPLIPNSELTAAKAAVIGRGFLIGRPIAMYLMDKVAELSVFASKTENLRDKLKNFDIIISGVGKENLFSAKDVKDGAIIIDFGYAKDENGKLTGDFNPLLTHNPQPATNNLFYTPTPGGTGAILVAQLFENFYILAHTGKSI